jgi:hypothetical protein
MMCTMKSALGPKFENKLSLRLARSLLFGNKFQNQYLMRKWKRNFLRGPPCKHTPGRQFLQPRAREERCIGIYFFSFLILVIIPDPRRSACRGVPTVMRYPRDKIDTHVISSSNNNTETQTFLLGRRTRTVKQITSRFHTRGGRRFRTALHGEAVRL